MQCSNCPDVLIAGAYCKNCASKLVAENRRLREALEKAIGAYEAMRTMAGDAGFPKMGDWNDAERLILEASKALSPAAEQPAAAQEGEGQLREFAGKLWERLNGRRCHLIQQKHRGRASAAECLELDELQELADENIRIMAPLSIEALERYMRERGIEIPEQPAESEKTDAQS